MGISVIGSNGGGGAETTFVTVGTGDEDYATVREANAAGFYAVKITTSVTEDATWTVGNENHHIVLDGPHVAWTYAANVEFTSTTHTKLLRIDLNGGALVHAPSSGSKNPINFTAGAGGGFVEFHGGGTITNNGGGVSGGTSVVDSGSHQKYFGHYVFNLQNDTQGGIYTSGRSLYVESVEFVGGGSSCSKALEANSPTDFVYVGHAVFSGTFAAGNMWDIDPAVFVTLGKFISNTTSASLIRLDSSMDYLQLEGSTAHPITFTDKCNIKAGDVSSTCTYTFPSTLGNLVFKNVIGAQFSIEPGIIEFKPTSTTDATKTQLFIDASALQFELASNDVAQCSLSINCVRDNQDEAHFLVPVFIAKNDGGTTTVSAPGELAGLTPHNPTGNGHSLRLDIEPDDTNDAPAIYITANASENWDHKSKLTVNLLNN